MKLLLSVFALLTIMVAAANAQSYSHPDPHAHHQFGNRQNFMEGGGG